MASFLKHTSCPSCGSRDNLAVYDDGSQWCFGCHYYLPPKHVSLNALQGLSEAPSATCLPLPDDIDQHPFSDTALEWLFQYGLTAKELVKHNISYSKSYDQVIFKFLDENGVVVAWQARNFREGRSTKYFTSGMVNTLLPIYHCPEPVFPGLVVLVEDCVSAIKISRVSDSMPVLGSGLPRVKLNRVAGLYERLNVWLDGNMYHNAQKIAKQAQMLGKKAYPIYTELDPKEYTDESILKYLHDSTELF